MFAAGSRSERLVNPDAYAKGTVFVQCQGCEVWHQLVDNMNLVKENDLREMPLSEAGQAFQQRLQASQGSESSGDLNSSDSSFSVGAVEAESMQQDTSQGVPRQGNSAVEESGK